MGASGWHYLQEVPAGRPVEPATALELLRARVFAEGDFYWEEDVDSPGPRPATLAALDELRETDEYWEVGSHSILDVDRVISSDAQDGEGTVRPLTLVETMDLFDTPLPDAAHFTAVMASWPAVPRWSGHCPVLYDGDRPVAVGFWGSSGD